MSDFKNKANKDFKIGAVILASGLSKRMGDGENKLLLSFFGKKLITYPVEACINAKDRGAIDDIVIVTSYREIVDIANSYNVEYVINENNTKGQSESIHLGVKHFYNYDAIAFFMGDMPFIEADDIEFICNHFDNEILVPKKGGNPTNPVIFPKRYYKELMEIEGDFGGRVVIKKHSFKEIQVEYDTKDIDVKEDF